MTLAVGTNSCSNCSSFGAISTFVWVTPVTLPPVKAGDEAELHRIAEDREDNGKAGNYTASAAVMR